MTFPVKIVLGEEAAKMHEAGTPDNVVEQFGDIVEYGFDSKAELDAFLFGLEVLDGWFGWTQYDPVNLK